MSSSTVICPEHLVISTVEEFKLELADALSTGVDIELDASDVAKVDSAGMQLLLAFKRAVEANKLAFKWLKVSTQFVVIAEKIGIHKELDILDAQVV